MPADTNLVGEKIRDPRSLVGFDFERKNGSSGNPTTPLIPVTTNLLILSQPVTKRISEPQASVEGATIQVRFLN